MVTLPEPSTLSEVCQEVVQPRPKMPVRGAAGNRRARRSGRCARDRLPGVGREASTADVSVVVGKAALAWETRNDQRLADVADLGRAFRRAR